MTFKSVVMGTGFVGPMHVEGLKPAGVEVAGIVGRTSTKTQAASEQLNLPCVYESFEAALRDATVNVVHLATPMFCTTNISRQYFTRASIASAKSLGRWKHH